MKNIVLKLVKLVKNFLQQFFITLQLYFENGVANHAAACAYGFLLSLAPMLLLLAFFIFFTYESSPHSVAAIIGTIPFLIDILDEQWLSSDIITYFSPSFTGFISVVSIIWAGRVLAMAILRGLRSVFPTGKKRNPVKNAMVILAIEISVIIFVLVVIVSSRTAMRIYRLFDFLPQGSVLRLLTSNFGIQVSAIFLLGFASFWFYRLVPLKPPRVISAVKGAVFCTIAYFCTVMLIGYIINRARYSFLYGTFGNLIIILINVYFFFSFFFIGAQFAFVTDFFDALLFSRMRKIRIKAAKKIKAIRQFNKLRPYYLLNKFFNPSKSNLNKYMRKYKKGDTIFSNEDMSDDIFYLLEGEVEMHITSGGESFAGVVKADSFFGEMGYMISEGLSVSAKAKTDVSVFAISSGLLELIIKYDTSFDKKLIEHMSRRLNKADDADEAANYS